MAPTPGGPPAVDRATAGTGGRAPGGATADAGRGGRVAPRGGAIADEAARLPSKGERRSTATAPEDKPPVADPARDRTWTRSPGDSSPDQPHGDGPWADDWPGAGHSLDADTGPGLDGRPASDDARTPAPSPAGPSGRTPATGATSDGRATAAPARPATADPPPATDRRRATGDEALADLPLPAVRGPVSAAPSPDTGRARARPRTAAGSGPAGSRRRRSRAGEAGPELAAETVRRGRAAARTADGDSARASRCGRRWAAGDAPVGAPAGGALAWPTPSGAVARSRRDGARAPSAGRAASLPSSRRPGDPVASIADWPAAAPTPCPGTGRAPWGGAETMAVSAAGLATGAPDGTTARAITSPRRASSVGEGAGCAPRAGGAESRARDTCPLGRSWTADGAGAVAARAAPPRPGTAVPGTAVPGTAVPGTAALGSAAPGRTRPGTTAPGTAGRRSVNVRGAGDHRRRTCRTGEVAASVRRATVPPGAARSGARLVARDAWSTTGRADSLGRVGPSPAPAREAVVAGVDGAIGPSARTAADAASATPCGAGAPRSRTAGGSRARSGAVVVTVPPAA